MSSTGTPSPGSLRVVFLVQGEGRGHLSQAMALREILHDAGHSVVGVLAGTSERRPLPPYFAQGMGLEPITFPSLLTVPGRSRKGVSLLRTLLVNLRRFPGYREGVRTVRAAVRELKPDLVVNFYEPVGGFALTRGDRPRVPMVAMGHQYLLGHPQAPRPPARLLQLLPFWVLNRISAPVGTPRFALSFRDLPDGPSPDTRVIPPLLRKGILQAEVREEGHILVYVLNDGYADSISQWHEDHPEVVIHGFWDRPDAAESEEVRPNLTFHRLSDTRFLEFMRGCRGFVGTAGFESVAEALWMGKPVMVVPTERHVEQAWNAREAEAAGAGISSEVFNLTPFLAYLSRHRPVTAEYQEWVTRGTASLLSSLESLAHPEGRTP